MRVKLTEEFIAAASIDTCPICGLEMPESLRGPLWSDDNPAPRLAGPLPGKSLADRAEWGPEHYREMLRRINDATQFDDEQIAEMQTDGTVCSCDPDAVLRAMGGDPEAIGRRAREMVERLLAQRRGEP